MAISDIKSLITSMLLDVAGCGLVLPYLPVATRGVDLAAVLGGDQTINFWGISLAEQQPVLVERNMNREALYTTTFLLGLYQSLGNPAVSEPAITALSEATILAFLPLTRRTEAPYEIVSAESLQLMEFTKVQLVANGQLCQYAGHHWRVQHRQRYL